MTAPEPVSTEILQTAIDRFWETFPPIWNTLRARLRDHLAQDFEITFEQFHILRHIRHGNGNVRDLAAVKQISRAAISQAVDILVHKGFVRRVPDLQDRRFISLSLTPKGDQLLDEIFQVNRTWMLERLSQATPEEIEHIQKGLDALYTLLLSSEAK